jgi:hypothetical protein
MLAGAQRFAEAGEAAVGPDDVGRHQEDERSARPGSVDGLAPDLVVEPDRIGGRSGREGLKLDLDDRAEALEGGMGRHAGRILRCRIDEIFDLNARREGGQIAGREERRQVGVEEHAGMPIPPHHRNEEATQAAAADRPVLIRSNGHQTSPSRPST